jgi:hypothetical protein
MWTLIVSIKFELLSKSLLWYSSLNRVRGATDRPHDVSIYHCVITSMCNHASYLHSLHSNTKWLRSNGHTWVSILCFSFSWSFSWRCPCQNVFLYIVECDDRLIGLLHWVLANLGNSMHLVLFGLESKRGYRNQSQEMHFIDSVVESLSPKVCR